MKVLIFGVNGFIGYHLASRLLADGRHEVVGLDREDSKIKLLKNSINFIKADIKVDRQTCEELIKESDVIFPLVAIATPALYIKNPLAVYELDFEENMRLIKLCVKYGKRLIFPSTSEVYGMSEMSAFDEDTSRLVVGPINKQRWIYSSCKQLLDRVIWAYGKEDQLDFTIFRPFNWVGPYLDSFEEAEQNNARVVTQFAYDISAGRSVRLVDGGNQRRSLTSVYDGVDCLVRILESKETANKEIFNIGNPNNNVSVKFIAEYIVNWLKTNRPDISIPDIISMSGKEFYGECYEDVSVRVPSISKAEKLLGWVATTNTDDILNTTLSHLFNR